jgi:acetyl esterase/lipase
MERIVMCIQNAGGRGAFFTLLFSSVVMATAAEPAPPASDLAVINLWREGAPLAKGDSEHDRPTITVYPVPAEKANGTGIVICPGGGYGHLAVGHEGDDIAKWFNEHGIAAFVLRYRIAPNGYRHPVPLLDVQRAIRTVRSRAREWGILPNRIGVIGFSAGGHLASTVSTHFDSGIPEANDVIDRASCRPDFAVLGYPAVMLGSPHTHKGSQKNLLGEEPDPKLIESLSNEKQVTKETPPTFLFHTNEDKAVPPENSVQYYLALRTHNVPAELHIYEKGKHGIGLGKDIPGTNTWPDRLADWLRSRGLLEKAVPEQSGDK